MKRQITLIILCIIAATLRMMAADNATATLDAAAKRLSASQSVTANFTISGNGQSATSGTLTLSGERFAMETPRMSVWYDGRTQWTYLPADNEVNISEPTPAELQQVNPLIIINSFRRAYTARTLSTTKSAVKIQLTAANKKADITSATVTINPTTKFPSKIRLVLSSGKSVTITITNIAAGKTVKADTFKFPKAKHPKAELIDLR